MIEDRPTATRETKTLIAGALLAAFESLMSRGVASERDCVDHVRSLCRYELEFLAAKARARANEDHPWRRKIEERLEKVSQGESPSPPRAEGGSAEREANAAVTHSRTAEYPEISGMAPLVVERGGKVAIGS